MNCKYLKILSIFSLSLVFCSVKGQESKTKVETDTIKVKKTDDRNVMLNASDANKPREISIGLPSEDVSVYENGLPVVYSSTLQSVGTHWRSDASLKNVSLLPISETAITTGNIAYAVNSVSNEGSETFSGVVNYGGNHFGLQHFNIAATGKITKNWYYAGSVYQNFDPGSFKIKYTNYQDRTQIYKGAVTRRFADKGRLSFKYKYSNSRRLDKAHFIAPFIYVGDGSVKEIPGFKLGTNTYVPNDGLISTMDILTGEVKQSKLNDGALNKANEAMINFDYRFDNGLFWKIDAKFMKSDNDYPTVVGSAITQVNDGIEVGTEGNPNAPIYHYEGTDKKYTGLKQNRLAYMHYGNITTTLLTTEVQKLIQQHNLRIGLNEWHYKIKYWSNTARFDQTVENNPTRLSNSSLVNGVMTERSFYGYNNGGSEFYDGYENKLALYMTDDWKATDKLNFYLGGRAEWYKYKGDNIPYARYEDFHLGSTNPKTGVVSKKEPFDGSYLNFSLTGSGTYHLTNSLGFTADATYTTKRPRIEDYATPNPPSTKQTSILLGRGGLFFKNDWISLTSLVSYITKKNNLTVINVTNPTVGSSELKATSFNYDIETLGWTTDMIVRPTNNFNLHFLFTYQRPRYKNFETDVNFDDGTKSHVSATGKIVTEIPRVLIEIDPSYTIANKINLWASFRYFSKTYANLSNALYFNGRWETFAGVKYDVNDKLTLSTTVVNFLNQTGASGSIQGAELISKEEVDANPDKYKNLWMTGKYIRPFTLEFAARIKF